MQSRSRNFTLIGQLGGNLALWKLHMRQIVGRCGLDAGGAH